MDHRALAGATWIAALVCYVATGRLARRSPHYGGGTVVLSWVGLVVPCIAWIAVIQGHFAVERAFREADPSTLEMHARNRRQFRAWALGYFVATAASAVLLKR
jgi:hypothetical protein